MIAIGTTDSDGKQTHKINKTAGTMAGLAIRRRRC